MKLRKRFIACFLSGVMVVSSVQFAVDYVYAEEVETEIEGVIGETEEQESGEESEWENVSSLETDAVLENESQGTAELDTVTVDTDDTQFESDPENSTEIIEILEEEQEESKIIDVSSAEIASGSCGTNLKWFLDDEGVLTISGSGKMEWVTIFDVPWMSYKEDIKSVLIVNGVTNIGRYAFNGCSSLTNIEMPLSVMGIEERAFKDCSSLKSIEIPSSVTNIEYYAFDGCSSLTSVEIPSSVTNIGGCAFNRCSSLTVIQHPRCSRSF